MIKKQMKISIENKIKLVIVEDNRELSGILEDFFGLTSVFELCGIAYDGEQALELIEQTKPDIVLLDLIMPKLDGISVLKKLNERAVSIPAVIVASAIHQQSITQEALSLGAKAYVAKPYELFKLSSLLERIYYSYVLKQRGRKNSYDRVDFQAKLMRAY